jgi:hypothetical protein
MDHVVGEQVAQFEFIDGYARDYLYPVAFTVAPGDIREAEDNPDPVRFQAVPAEEE